MITLYTVGCSKKSLILEKKLKQKNIKFFRVSDEEIIKAKGYSDWSFPLLDVNGIVMSYTTATRWINNQIGGV